MIISSVCSQQADTFKAADNLFFETIKNLLWYFYRVLCKINSLIFLFRKFPSLSSALFSYFPAENSQALDKFSWIFRMLQSMINIQGDYKVYTVVGLSEMELQFATRIIISFWCLRFC